MLCQPMHVGEWCQGHVSQAHSGLIASLLLLQGLAKDMAYTLIPMIQRRTLHARLAKVQLWPYIVVLCSANASCSTHRTACQVLDPRSWRLMTAAIQPQVPLLCFPCLPVLLQVEAVTQGLAAYINHGYCTADAASKPARLYDAHLSYGMLSRHCNSRTWEAMAQAWM